MLFLVTLVRQKHQNVEAALKRKEKKRNVDAWIAMQTLVYY